MEDHEPLFGQLSDLGMAKWVDVLRTSESELLAAANNGHMPAWQAAIGRLPNVPATFAGFDSPSVTFDGEYSDDQQAILRESLEVFLPWRKGPFEIFGIHIDTEWRSDLKWQRVAPHVDWRGKAVLDVGCGNGYYGWRMLGAGAGLVVGLEPYPLYNMQHAIFRKYAAASPNYVVPATDRALSHLDQNSSVFDVATSMGVLYHCKNPIGHLDSLRRSLKPQGQLVLETLVIDGDVETALIPQDRYAKMRNVWLIPSTLMLERLLQRGGFRDVHVVDVTQTTKREQRSTEWMRFESLADFLDPADSSKTIEGYAAPKRAIMVATRP